MTANDDAFRHLVRELARNDVEMLMTRDERRDVTELRLLVGRSTYAIGMTLRDDGQTRLTVNGSVPSDSRMGSELDTPIPVEPAAQPVEPAPADPPTLSEADTHVLTSAELADPNRTETGEIDGLTDEVRNSLRNILGE